MDNSKGDLELISAELGIPIEQIRTGELIRVDFKLSEKTKVFIPSGNEFGTNSQWIPGGKLPNKKDEAIISLDGLIEGKDYTISKIKIK